MNVCGTYTPEEYGINTDTTSIYNQVHSELELKDGKVNTFYTRYYRKCRVAFARYIIRDKRRRSQKRG